MVAVTREQIGHREHVDATALANAATAVAVAAYAICRVLALIAPEALGWVAQTWFHGLALAPAGPTSFGLGPIEFVVGLMTVGGFVWLATAATAWLYNTWRRA